jgi:NADPH2:quinone reductase
MKAIRVNEFGSSDVMRLEEVQTPQPGPQQVLVKVEAIGVNPVDTYIRSGIYAVKPNLPYTPGSDAAGTVVETGEGVNRLQAGQRVYTAGTLSGAYAEYALCEERRVHPLPDNVSFEEGAGLFVPYATAYRALFQKARAKAGETVLIHGASGGVGIAAVQLARAAGLKIIGTAGTDEGLKLIAEQGAHYALNHRDANYLDEVTKLTSGLGVDLVLEMLANVNLGKDLTIIKTRGRVVIIGSRGSLDFDPRLTMSKDAIVYGMAMLNATTDELNSIHAALFAGLEKGFLHPVIGNRFNLAEAAKAHDAVMATGGAYGKIVLVP